MTEKKTYWLVDSAGTAAAVEGAAERDRWLPHGWTETDEEPTGDTFVWASNPDVQDPAKFPADALREVWSAKGWLPSAPPEPLDPLTGERPARPAVAPVPTNSAAAPAEETSTQAKTAAGGDKETKTRG